MENKLCTNISYRIKIMLPSDSNFELVKYAKPKVTYI